MCMYLCMLHTVDESTCLNAALFLFMVYTYAVHYMHIYVWVTEASHPCCMCMTCHAHTPSHPTGLMRLKRVLCIGCLTSKPKVNLWPKELWFSFYSCTCTGTWIAPAILISLQSCVLHIPCAPSHTWINQEPQMSYMYMYMYMYTSTLDNIMSCPYFTRYIYAFEWLSLSIVILDLGIILP